MKSLGGVGVAGKDLRPTLQQLDGELKAKKTKAGEVEAKVAKLVKADPGLAEQWSKATMARRNREQAILSLIDGVDMESAQELRDSYVETRRLSSAVTSFRNLCRQLDAANDRGEDAVIGKLAAPFQKDARVQMLRDIDTVSRGIKAAGLCEAASKFPLAQLAALKETVRTQVAKLEQAAAPEVRPLLKASDVATVETAAAALADMLGRPELAEGLTAAGARAEDPKGFARDLTSFALMLDQAGTAPDYSTTRMGWHYGYSRGEYRNRQHFSEPFLAYLSEGRLEATHELAQGALEQVVGAKAPAKALQDSLTKRFMSEIGVHPSRSKGWQPTSQGISKIVAHEGLLPLRALNETIQDMAKRFPGTVEQFEGAVSNITKAMVEGNYKEWRTNNPASARQLRPLSDAQREAWLGHTEGKSLDAPHGGRLTSREEDDVDLLWLTKIGGPSHGFDFGGHCLLPLLANARTRAIVIEDTKWPDNPAARAYLRLLENKDGEPVLYLEPLQRDFPHRDTFKDPDLDAYYVAALVEHAAAKAREMGVPLSIDARWGGIAEFAGLETKPDPKPEMVLAGSGGVLEASDTMTRLHDWVQTEDMVIKPHNPRITFTPEGA